MDDDGTQHEDPRGGMEKVVVSYFTTLFTSNVVIDFEDILDNVTPSISEEMNIGLERPITDKEVKRAVFQMHHTKAPGPDGMSPEFYKKH